MTSTTRNLFDRDAVKAMIADQSGVAAKAAFPQMVEAIKADYAEQAEREQMTTFRAAMAARTAIRNGVLAAGKGKTGSLTAAKYGETFVGANGRTVSASTVGLWINLGFCLVDVPGFEYDGNKDDKHAKLFSALVSSGAGTAKSVTEVIRGDKPTPTKIAKALKAELDQRKAKKEGGTATPDTTTDTAGNGATEEDGTPTLVAPSQSSLERGLQALVLIQQVLPDLHGRDFQRFAKAYAKVTEEVTAAQSALDDMVAEDDKRLAETA